MGIKHLREENGSGLVLTLMVLLVFSVLGISIGTLTLGSYRLGAANRDATSAYYVAEAGAVAAYEEIQSQVLGVYNGNATEAAFYESISGMVSALPKLSSVDFEPQFGSKPTATITTAREGDKKYTITSTGEVDGKKRTVTKEFTVNWIEKNTGGGGGFSEEQVLLTSGPTDISGKKIEGDIYSGGNVVVSGGQVEDDIYTNGSFTISNGTVEGQVNSYGNAIVSGGQVEDDIYTKGSFTISNGTVEGQVKSYGNVIVSGGKVDDDIFTKGSVTVSGGTLEEDVYTNGIFAISGGALKGDIYTNYIGPGSLQITNWPDMKSTTLFYPDTVTAEEKNKLVSSSNQWFPLPDLKEIKGGWDSNFTFQDIPNIPEISENPSFKVYQDYIEEIEAPDKSKLVEKGDINISRDFTLDLDSDVYISNITSTGQYKITINTNAKDRTILVDKMVIDSKNLIIEGGGILTIFVTDKLDISKLPKFNKINPDSIVNLVFLGKAPVVLSNWQDANINANIIIKDAPISANTTKINGVLLTGGDKVELSGGASGSNMMLIAPNAVVSLTESYTIKGSVIAKQFSMSGSASLEYAAIDTSGFPSGGTSAPADNPELGDLISSWPIIEK